MTFSSSTLTDPAAPAAVPLRTVAALFAAILSVLAASVVVLGAQLRPTAGSSAGLTPAGEVQASSVRGPLGLGEVGLVGAAPAPDSPAAQAAAPGPPGPPGPDGLASTDVLSPQAATPAPPEAGPEVARVPLVDGGPKLVAFEGLSTWIDLYDTEVTPAAQADIAAAGGVQTIFVQTARFNSPTDIHDATRLGQLIEAAHDRGLRVMVWYIPDFLDLARDERRSQAAMAFVTPRGDRPDAFGLDIETEHVADPVDRSARLVELSERLRAWAGTDYPMAAIVLPPLQLDLRPDWWPAFPYEALRDSYDVFVPMSYSSFRGTDAETTYRWNLANVRELRTRAGHPDLPVHLAGGIADNLPEVAAFTRSAGDAGVLGAGLYDLHTTRPDAWPALRALRREG